MDARNPTLEAAIEKDPYDETAYSVFGDWLQEQGDPRGELIALSLANQPEQVAQRIAANADYFLGPLAPHQECYDNLSWKKEKKYAFTWKYGFIHSCRLSYNQYWVEKQVYQGPLADLFRDLLHHPSGRFLAEIVMMYNDDPSEDDLQDLLDLLAQHAPKTVRRLVLGDEVDQISWYNIGDLGAVWRALPNLVDLYIEAGSFTLGRIDAPALRKAVFKTGGLSRASGDSIANGRFPKLEHLEVYYGDANYGAECTFDQAAPLLARTDLPALRHLALANCAFVDEICEALPKSKLLAQLTSLDLSMGIMSDAGARHILDHADAFQHLTSLNLSDNYLTEGTVSAFANLGTHIATDSQKEVYDDDPDYRHVSIGE